MKFISIGLIGFAFIAADVDLLYVFLGISILNPRLITLRPTKHCELLYS